MNQILTPPPPILKVSNGHVVLTFHKCPHIPRSKIQTGPNKDRRTSSQAHASTEDRSARKCDW